MLAESVKAKQPDLVVELVTGSSDADKKQKSQAGEGSTDLVVKKAEEQALASMSNTLSKDEREALLAVVRRKTDWDRRAAAVMQKRAHDRWYTGAPSRTHASARAHTHTTQKHARTHARTQRSQACRPRPVSSAKSHELANHL